MPLDPPTTPPTLQQPLDRPCHAIKKFSKAIATGLRHPCVISSIVERDAAKTQFDPEEEADAACLVALEVGGELDCGCGVAEVEERVGEERDGVYGNLSVGEERGAV